MKFKVRLTRNVTESCDVIVDANNLAQAQGKALDKAGQYGEKVTGWALDEGNLNEVYVADPFDIELVKGK